MACSKRLVRQLASHVLPQSELFALTARQSRAFTSATRYIAQTGRTARSSKSFGPRFQTRCASNQTQVAPNAKTYLESGAIAGGQNLVDVKKVLVIGSGGLSIGQAGEFDYSGRFWHCPWAVWQSSRELALTQSWRSFNVQTKLTILEHRLASVEGPKRSWGAISTDQPEHRDHSDCARACG